MKTHIYATYPRLPLETNEEYVSYDMYLVTKTINYILAEIYDHHWLKPMCI